MFRSKEDHSIDMTLAGFTYLLACRRWPEGGYSADEYDAIALSASKVFPAMATREEVKLAGKKQTGGQLNAGCRTLAAAGATGREQIFIPLRFVLKQLGGLARLGARQATKRPGGERNMPEIARPRL
ncbi:MAG: hypothetical protein J2P49_09080 [Methylocapsa sp.]|nr:hypothetical protein [Methylocapsa sp.]